MTSKSLILCLLAGLLVAVATVSAEAGPRRRAARYFQPEGVSWHGPYYNQQYSEPLALVVPPTAGMQTHWEWGVPSMTRSPIYHQYGRAYPGAMDGNPNARFLPTPIWPSHTDQFGVYYIRGPW